MYTTDFLHLLKRHIALCRRLKTFPFDMDHKTNRLYNLADPTLNRRQKAMCVLALAYVTSLLTNLVLGKFTFAEKALGFAFLVPYGIELASMWNFGLDEDLVQVINSFMEFEKTVMKGDKYKIIFF